MKILITGSSGFIGKNLEKYLQANHTLYLWDIKDIGADIFLNEIEPVIKKADIVVHLAALTSVEKSFKHPQKYYYTNVMGTARVAQLCQKYGKKMIFLSSASVKDPDSSPYARSKYLGEEIVKLIDKWVILRCYNIYGKGMNPENEAVMYNFLHNRKLVIYGDGRQTRDFINVSDVVRIIEDSFKNKWNGNVVDIGLGYSYTINYLAKLIAKMRGLEIEHRLPREEIKHSIADNKLLKQLYKKPLRSNIEKDIYEI